MRFILPCFTTFYLILLIFPHACFSSCNIQKYGGRTTGRHIVRLNPEVNISTFLKNVRINPTFEWEELKAFGGQLTQIQIATLCNNANVQTISEDGVVMPNGIESIQYNAPWGLARLSSSHTLAAGHGRRSYTYHPSAGAGVDIYIMDTGVYLDHSDFEHRAHWGKIFVPHADQKNDRHGHGAAIAAGAEHGVAKRANIIAVKVLDDEGKGSIIDAAVGMRFVLRQYQTSKRPSIASMSLGAPGEDRLLDDAVALLTNAGVYVVAAAGNSGIDARGTSPARAQNAITVGAVNIGDRRASFSNYGPAVDIFAPGVDIQSAWIGTPDAKHVLLGTSMAAPTSLD